MGGVHDVWVFSALSIRVRSNKAARKPHSLRAALEIIHPFTTQGLIPGNFEYLVGNDFKKLHHGVDSRELPSQR